MSFHHGLLLKTAAVAVMAWMAGNTAVAQSNAQNFGGGSTIKVDCNKKGSIGAMLAHLSQIGNTRGVTISVTGTCKENVTIIGFDHLVLQGVSKGTQHSPTLEDASNGTAAVVFVVNSYDVTLQGFTINGGSPGVGCVQDSFCTLYLNTIQQSFSEGVRVARASAILLNNSILDNAARGVSAVNGSKLHTISNTISNNSGGGGIFVFSDSYVFSENDTIQSNPVGILGQSGSVLRLGGVTISDNIGDGVRLESSSTASFGANVVTRNGHNGVAIYDLSFASFNGDNVSGNLGQPDVACYPQFSATRGAGTVGGTTNCPN
ncbi:MAG TPA: right-handed parallel beta-helix repeat-containing protein [Terriglobales bacterium]